MPFSKISPEEVFQISYCWTDVAVVLFCIIFSRRQKEALVNAEGLMLKKEP